MELDGIRAAQRAAKAAMSAALRAARVPCRQRAAPFSWTGSRSWPKTFV